MDYNLEITILTLISIVGIVIIFLEAVYIFLL